MEDERIAEKKTKGKTKFHVTFVNITESMVKSRTNALRKTISLTDTFFTSKFDGRRNQE